MLWLEYFALQDSLSFTRHLCSLTGECFSIYVHQLSAVIFASMKPMEMSLSCLLRAVFLLVSSNSHSIVLLLSGFFSMALRSLAFPTLYHFKIVSTKLTYFQIALPKQLTGCGINAIVASSFPWQVSLKVEKLLLSAMIPGALKSKGLENGRMQFILLKLDSASFVTVSTCHCLWFSLVTW